MVLGEHTLNPLEPVFGVYMETLREVLEQADRKAKP